MAISAVKTSHIVYADIDFWPSADLHDILSKNEMKERFAKDAKLATIIPVFQMFRRCKEYKDEQYDHDGRYRLHDHCCFRTTS